MRTLKLALALMPCMVTAQARLTNEELHRLYATTTKHWRKAESEAFVRIVLRESGGNPNCTTSRSSSAGLFGFLRGTRQAYRVTLKSSLEDQARAFLSYCVRRYGSVEKAWAHHRRCGWY